MNDNIVKSPEDIRDYTIQKLGLTPITQLYEKLQPPTTIRNQGDYGTCFAQFLSSVLEQAYLDETGVRQLFSPAFIYVNKGDAGEGTYPRDCLQIIRKKGGCRNELFNEQGTFQELQAKYWANDKYKHLEYDAKAQRLDTFFRVTTPAEVLSAMELPKTYMGLAINILETSFVDGSGIWTQSGRLVGGHMVRLLGLKNINGEWCYKIQNSWGDTWGYGGCAYVRCSDATIIEMWAVTDRKLVEVLELTIGQTTYTKNGVAKTMLLAPQIVNGTTLVPVRLISEEYGADVQYNATSKKITITL